MQDLEQEDEIGCKMMKAFEILASWLSEHHDLFPPRFGAGFGSRVLTMPVRANIAKVCTAVGKGMLLLCFRAMDDENRRDQ